MGDPDDHRDQLIIKASNGDHALVYVQGVDPYAPNAIEQYERYARDIEDATYLLEGLVADPPDSSGGHE